MSLVIVIIMLNVALASESVDRVLTAMGTLLHVHTEAPTRAIALRASEAAVQSVVSTEARLGWSPSSELSRLNAAPVGAVISLSGDFIEALRFAQSCYALTNGAFDPSLGTGLSQVLLSATSGSRAADVHLDAGAFGKGWALDEALRAAKRAGAQRVMLDLGGQLLVSGAAFRVGVAHPRRRTRRVRSILLDERSAATSGNSERPGHLIDPRTQEPAHDFGAVTVIAKSAALADCVSTAAFVMGPEVALRWAEGRTDLSLITVEPRWWGPRVRYGGL